MLEFLELCFHLGLMNPRGRMGRVTPCAPFFEHKCVAVVGARGLLASTSDQGLRLQDWTYRCHEPKRLRPRPVPRPRPPGEGGFGTRRRRGGCSRGRIGRLGNGTSSSRTWDQESHGSLQVSSIRTMNRVTRFPASLTPGPSEGDFGHGKDRIHHPHASITSFLLTSCAMTATQSPCCVRQGRAS